jgi:predicted metal-binding membrane protein
LTTLAFLAVAAFAWAFMILRSRSMDGMAMDPGSLGPFAASWTVMMAAMMLPSALPLVFEFARDAEGRRRWQTATVVLGATYLSIWLAFGIACYLVRAVVPASWSDQRLVGAAALALAALYGVTPIRRASEARCRELCALHGPLPFNLMRSAVVVGVKYGLSCVGCSAALMVAMVVIGMANVGWIVAVSTVVLAYKLASTPSTRRTLLLSTALVALGVIYGLMT